MSTVGLPPLFSGLSFSFLTTLHNDDDYLYREVPLKFTTCEPVPSHSHSASHSASFSEQQMTNDASACAVPRAGLVNHHPHRA